MDWDPQSADTQGYVCPPCPVFYPTLEEFQHPLKYISSIRHIGMQAGICKIIPPKGWQPPYSINEKTFRFRTRLQQLNCLEAHSRAEGHFVEALRMFLYVHGTPMQELPRIDGQLVNLHALFKSVMELGGYDKVCALQQWATVARAAGRSPSPQEPSPIQCEAFRQVYERNLRAFEDHERGKLSMFKTPMNQKDTAERFADIPSASSTASNTPQTKTRQSMRKTRGRERSNTPELGTEEVEGDDSLLSPNSKRVKRTLFGEVGHTSSEENDSDLKADAAGSNAQSKTGKESLMEQHSEDDCTEENLNDGDQLKENIKDANQNEDVEGIDIEENAENDESDIRLDPEALKPDPSRKRRLPSPKVRVGQKFYQFFPNTGAVVAEVKRVLGGKSPHHVLLRYDRDGSKDTVEYSTAQIIVANGWSPEAAELAFKSEICQSCLRGDCWNDMLLCDGCNSGHHTFCLAKPIDKVPAGDWYCDSCVEESTELVRDGKNPKFGFENGNEYNVIAYKEKADEWKRSYFGVSSQEDLNKLTDKELEQEYWRLLSLPVHEQRLEVEYGSDIDSGSLGSGFPRHDLYQRGIRFLSRRWKAVAAGGRVDPGGNDLLSMFSAGIVSATESGMSFDQMVEHYASSDWNLNNLPKLKGSVLQYLDEDIKGVMVPWIYMGMCFSTFCWHVEDHNFYSISYMHCGAPKIWYGIPCEKADLFEATMRKLTPELFGSQPDLHMQLVTMFSPQVLRKHGVPVYRATHRPNEFMVTFPSAYHAGFNTGFNCAEAVNFATLDWLPWGAKALRNYRKFCKLPVFAHEALVITLAETILDGGSFEFESTHLHLLPALKSLVDEYFEFERTVRDFGVTKKEMMSDFAARTGTGRSVLGQSQHSRACKMMASTSTAEKDRAAKNRAPNETAAGNRTVARKSKMAIKSERPSRMVLWAGRSGKNEGLRCVSCKQYCYLQAVMCLKCKHNSSVGCIEHFSSMCHCDANENYCYLYRYEAAYLISMIQALETRLQRIEAWHKQFDEVFGLRLKSDSGGQCKGKLSITALKKLQTSGMEIAGVDDWRLNMITQELNRAALWAERLEQVVQQRKSGADASLAALMDLETELAQMVVVPQKVSLLEVLLKDGRDCVESMHKLLGQVNMAAERIHSINRSSQRPSMGSLDEPRQYRKLLQSIDDTIRQMDMLGIFTSSDKQQMSDARTFIEFILDLDALCSKINARLKDPKKTEPLFVHHCMKMIQRGDSIQQAQGRGALGLLDFVRQHVHSAINEGAELGRLIRCEIQKSTEEMEALHARAMRFPICPDEVNALGEHITKCKQWEVDAQSILEGASSKDLLNRPSLDDIMRFFEQAESIGIAPGSLVYRQLHARIQDCHRWYSSAHALLVKPADTTTLIQVLQDMKRKLVNYDQRVDHHSTRLYCTCRQILSSKAPTTTCRRCGELYHVRCIEAEEHVNQPYTCKACRGASQGKGKQKMKATSSSVPIFCICRESVEDRPMICCDYCDEWYHSDCIELPVETMTSMEAFRCHRCAIQQNLFYVDKKVYKHEYTSRRPTLGRVEAVMTQLETLIGLPNGAREMYEYVQLVKQLELDTKKLVATFTEQFSIAEFSSVDFQQEEAKVIDLIRRLIDLEVNLDAALGSLVAVHWCLRACHMVLDCDHAPKYSHLVLLLGDTDQPHFVFPRSDFFDIQAAIQERVTNASRWLKQVKTLEIEEWNISKAKRLLAEYQELSQFLELPEAEVALVHQVANSAPPNADVCADPSPSTTTSVVPTRSSKQKKIMA